MSFLIDTEFEKAKKVKLWISGIEKKPFSMSLVIDFDD